jgi:hypothetical protein
LEQTVQTRIIQIFLEDMQAIAQGQLHGYTHGKRPRDFARLPVSVYCTGRRTVLLYWGFP